MIIQIILIVAFLFIVIRFLANPANHRMQAWQKIFGVLFFFLAVFAVLFPETLNDIAHIFGVGRGADLMLYLLVLAFIAVVFNLYVKEAHDRKRTVRLVRAIAVTEANNNAHNKTQLKKLGTKKVS